MSISAHLVEIAPLWRTRQGVRYVVQTTTHLSTLFDVAVRESKDVLQGLHCEPCLLGGDGQVSNDKHSGAVGGVKPQLDLSFDLLLVCHLGVVDKRPSTGVGRLVASGCVLQAFDDGCFSAAIVSHNDGDWIKELDDRYLLVVKGTNAADGELVETRHGVRRQTSSFSGTGAGVCHTGALSHMTDTRCHDHPEWSIRSRAFTCLEETGLTSIAIPLYNSIISADRLTRQSFPRYFKLKILPQPVSTICLLDAREPFMSTLSVGLRWGPQLIGE